MTQASSSPWLSSFRKHRHDILNELQLVQGYLQLQKPDCALAAVRRLSAWLQNLSALQAQLEPPEALILAAASGSPHVTFHSCTRTRVFSVQEVAALAAFWTLLEEVVVECGEDQVGIAMLVDQDKQCLDLYCTQKFHEFVQPRKRLVEHVSNISWQLRFQLSAESDG